MLLMFLHFFLSCFHYEFQQQQDMDKQDINQNHRPQSLTLYPDISQIPYLLQNQTQQKSEPIQQQGFNPNPPPQSAPTQQLNFHTIKSLKSWKDLVKQTIDWVNKSIHPIRVVSITVVLCHSTRAGQCTIFYNGSKDQYMKMKIMPFQKCCLSAAIVNTAKKWDDHHLDVMKTVAEVASGGAVVGVSQLETGLTHGTATSVVWFLKKF